MKTSSKHIDSPSIARRYIATFIDGIFIIFIIILAGYLFEGNDGIVQTTRISLVVLAFLVYEPLLTSRFHTIGQGYMGVRVRKRKDLTRISIMSAYIRILMKIILGIISFVTIPFTNERRGIHDFAAGSVVVDAASIE
jgi:uncharacterized RDD family membrane protein YckC